MEGSFGRCFHFFSISDRIYDRFFRFPIVFFVFPIVFATVFRFSIVFSVFFGGCFLHERVNRRDSAPRGSVLSGNPRNPAQTSGSLDQVRAQVLSKGEYKVLDLLYRSIDLSIYRSIYPSIYLSIDLSIYRSIYLSIYRSIDLSIYLSIDLSIYRSIYLS